MIDSDTLATLIEAARRGLDDAEYYVDSGSAAEDRVDDEYREMIVEYREVLTAASAVLADGDRVDPDAIPLRLAGDWAPVLDSLTGWVIGLELATGETVDLFLTAVTDSGTSVCWHGVRIDDDDAVDEIRARWEQGYVESDTVVLNSNVVRHILY